MDDKQTLSAAVKMATDKQIVSPPLISFPPFWVQPVGPVVEC